MTKYRPPFPSVSVLMKHRQSYHSKTTAYDRPTTIFPKMTPKKEKNLRPMYFKDMDKKSAEILDPSRCIQRFIMFISNTPFKENRAETFLCKPGTVP